MNWKDTIKEHSVAKGALSELIPWPPSTTAEAFVRQHAPNNQQSALACKAAIEVANQDRAEFVRDYARDLLRQESDRQASVMSRAQSLYFAVSLLASVLTIGLGFAGPVAAVDWVVYLGIFLVAVTVGHIALLAVSVSKAVSGIGYPRAGASDLTRWVMQNDETAALRDEAVATLAWYREASLLNTWRFEALSIAQRALRNLVVCMCALVLLALSSALLGRRGPVCENRVEVVSRNAPVFFAKSDCRDGK